MKYSTGFEVSTLEITENLLETIVNEQEISALGLVTPDGRPHCTPVWTHHYKGHLYIFSRKSRAKIRYAAKSGQCMIAFDFASVRGTLELIEKGSDEYTEIYDIPDARYGTDSQLQFYKDNWDVAVKVTPTKVYR